MIEGIPKISVLIICYKQEELIKRAINSLLVQKDYLYEICVSDDCSPDNTWNVLLDYQSKYPDLIKLNRNEPNVGIFENMERNWDMPTGDVVYQMSGDDEAVDGFFKKIVDFISEKGIDFKNELFCIYSNYKILYPNGDYRVAHKNSVIAKYPDVLRLAMRGRICNRGCCYSINVLKKFDKVSQGRSQKVEHLQDRLLQFYSEKNYYISCVGNVYYSSIGVSTNINEAILQERAQIVPYAVDFFEKKGVVFCRKDVFAFKYNMYHYSYILNHKFSDLIKGLWYKFACKDLKFPRSSDSYKRIVFAVLRRLPHKKPICFD